MAEVVQDPELRYTSDTQTPIAEMIVQIPGLRTEDPPATLKVVGWGNLAQEIQQRFHQGDQVVIEGRLSMNTVDRPEGFKEKRAEITAQRIHTIAIHASTSVVKESSGSYTTPQEPPTEAPKTAAPKTAAKPKSSPPPASEADYDEIPF